MTKLDWPERFLWAAVFIVLAFLGRVLVTRWNDPPKQEVTVVEKKVDMGEDCWK